MSNIWEFLLQTMEITLTALLILVLKWFFQDKLSPRWQYGVWALLAAKLLVPAGLFRSYISLDLSAGLQVLKRTIECRMESQFSDIYGVIRPDVGIPMSSGAPVSLTDWLFMVYLAGVLAMAAWYLTVYFRLKWILRKAWVPAEGTCQKVDVLCRQYNLKSCRIRILDGIDSAFICGFIRPIMVIPAAREEELDEKILLHELLHLKHFDVWQNGFWCCMRCIHWCNPAMHYILNRIGNDMESLCDQRVLERIEGEDRRDYGRILLSMTNQKYARALGTTSLSNGGSNIKRRIEAIVRFKKYPKGMALVSICICLLVAAPVFGGTRQGVDLDNDFIWSSDEVSLAKIQMQGCTTAAGAIDCYTKGMLQGNRRYLAAALPAEQQSQLKQMAENSPLHPEYDSYFVVNLEEDAEDRSYPYVLLYRENTNAYVEDEEEDEDILPFAVTALPLEVKKENHRWVASGAGELIHYNAGDRPAWNYQYELPALDAYEGTCETGTVILEEQSYHYVKTETTDEWSWFGFGEDVISQWADPDAVFHRHELHYVVKYEHDMTNPEWNPAESIALSARVLTDDNPHPNWSEDVYARMTSGGSAGSDGDAVQAWTVDADWDGKKKMDTGFFEHDKGIKEAKKYAVRIYVNKLPQDVIFLERGDTDAH